jgi:hypothetical protein
MWRATLVILCVLGLPLVVSAQEDTPAGPTLTISAAERDQTFEVQVKTADGTILPCQELVTARSACKLQGVPAGTVTVLAKIGEKQMKELPLKVSPVGAQVFLQRDSLGLVFFAGTVAALSAATLTFEIIEGNVKQIIESAVVLGVAAGATAFLLARGRDRLIANGKTVKKDGALRAMIHPTLIPTQEKPTIGVGVTVISF